MRLFQPQLGKTTVSLRGILARSGGMDDAGAHAYVNELMKNHHYLRDVY
jgi:sulfite reductase (NADPH) flavoprotein alpha-component